MDKIKTMVAESDNRAQKQVAGPGGDYSLFRSMGNRLWSPKSGTLVRVSKSEMKLPQFSLSAI